MYSQMKFALLLNDAQQRSTTKQFGRIDRIPYVHDAARLIYSKRPSPNRTFIERKVEKTRLFNSDIKSPAAGNKSQKTYDNRQESSAPSDSYIKRDKLGPTTEKFCEPVNECSLTITDVFRSRYRNE
ncbi:hypothetical protein T265_04202 [Opisthorchis viverrini]|uniref:Uncharacterized protein n=1 Tax=Opisthorchis viverrini TaxID=6198 RepID=A0A075AGW0_OPIVI|nr:hypothetical protein T265_04202 [Opisthorchis viverrini]KER29114.1 hypothetical protein T265_04202 [Opisthorchis viverrini]